MKKMDRKLVIVDKDRVGDGEEGKREEFGKREKNEKYENGKYENGKDGEKNKYK